MNDAMHFTSKQSFPFFFEYIQYAYYHYRESQFIQFCWSISVKIFLAAKTTVPLFPWNQDMHEYYYVDIT